jgi:hypothetical protein
VAGPAKFQEINYAAKEAALPVRIWTAGDAPAGPAPAKKIINLSIDAL